MCPGAGRGGWCCGSSSAGSAWAGACSPASVVCLSDAFRIQTSTALASCPSPLTGPHPGPPRAWTQQRETTDRKPPGLGPAPSDWVQAPADRAGAQSAGSAPRPTVWVSGSQGSRDSGLHSALGPPGRAPVCEPVRRHRCPGPWPSSGAALRAHPCAQSTSGLFGAC